MEHFKTNQVFIYPVKSLGHVTMSQFEFDDKGLKFDRNWMIVDQQNRMITQREFPELNLIYCLDSGTQFKLYIKDKPDECVVFDKEYCGFESSDYRIWNHDVTANRTLTNVSLWLSDYLKTKLSIVGNPIRTKSLHEYHIPHSVKLAFQDSGPVHLVNLSSVDYVSEHCKQFIDPLQFRANIYIRLDSPFMEDDLEMIEINGIRFKKIKACERCIMSTIKPGSSKFQKEPLNWLSKHRKHNNKVHFGIYLFPLL